MTAAATVRSMSTVIDRISHLDPEVFAPIDSQTSPDDKRALLAIQRAVRSRDSYIYLEIGSHLGGTLQTHYVDPQCRRIYSIDARPKFTADVRGQHIHYPDNSSARMRKLLIDAYGPVMDASGVSDKLLTFDCDATAVPRDAMQPPPDVCFIDGEHTIPATRSDFRVCEAVAAPDAVFVFHDTDILFEAILAIEADLAQRGIQHRGLLLSGVVYVILRGKAVDWYANDLQTLAQNRDERFEGWRRYLAKTQREVRRHPQLRVQRFLTRFPRLYDAVRAVRNALSR